MRALPIVLVLSATLSASAQVVHPNAYALVEGVTNNSIPYNQTTARYQQSYQGSQFPGPIVIENIGYRYKGDVPKAATTADIKVTISYCAVPHDQISTSFAANVGAAPTVVFNGIWNLPAFTGDPALPNPFTARIPFLVPFVYNPAAGDLLIEVEVRQGAMGSGAFARADNNQGVRRLFNTSSSTAPTGTIDFVGLITEFNSGACTADIAQGCPGSGGATPQLFAASCPTAGSQFSVLVGNALGGATAVLLLGAQPAQVPLGFGCTLNLSPVFPAIVTFPLSGAGPGGGTANLVGPVPAGSTGASIVMQVFVIDPGAVGGFANTPGLQITVQ